MAAATASHSACGTAIGLNNCSSASLAAKITISTMSAEPGTAALHDAADGAAAARQLNEQQNAQQETPTIPSAEEPRPAPPPGGDQPPLPLQCGQGKEAATIVRHSCDLLALPTRVGCTALTFLHRINPAELPPLRLAAACVFLAAKVEEASVRTNDMLNAVAAWRLAATTSTGGDGGSSGGGAGGSQGRATNSVSHGGADDETAAQRASAADAGAAAVAAFPCLVGEAYAASKRQLICDEQLLLRRLQFDIGVDQPHRHLYVLAQCWGAGAHAVRAATCLLNDAVAHCGGYARPGMPPAVAAAAALHVGGQLVGGAVSPPGWWRATGISDGEMAAACGSMLDLLQVP